MKRIGHRLEQWPLARLQPYARNSRQHSDEQVAKVAASITRFGFTNPILASDDGTIVAGHGRLLAARLLGLETVPVIQVSGWSDDERRAYVIADNQLALEAGWDEDLLALELGYGGAADLVNYTASLEILHRRIDELTHERDMLQASAGDRSTVRWLPLKVAAYDAGIPYERVRAWAARGWIESRKANGRVKVNITSLAEYYLQAAGR